MAEEQFLIFGGTESLDEKKVGVGDAGARSVDGARVDGARVEGSSVDGARVDGSSVDGARVDGSRVDGARGSGWKFEGDLRGKRIFVVDAYGLIYQVFHALPPMFGRDGEIVNAVFGFVRDLFLILEHQKPDLLFCAFDLHAPTFRSQMFSEYKATREKMPEELISQIPRVREILDALRIPVLALEGFEADDILATVAERTTELGGECVLVTSDKDSRQLISDRVSIFSLRRNLYLDRAFLESDWGIEPEQVVDYQALVGDSSDNVPGIALIGPKMAKELLGRFGTLEEILKPENIESFFGPRPTKKKENLLHGRATALLCQALVRLERNVPIRIDWESGATERFDFLGARSLFEQYEFRSLIQKSETLAKMEPGGRSVVGGSVLKEGQGSGNGATLPEAFEESLRSRATIPFFDGRFDLKEGEAPDVEGVLILPPSLFQEESGPESEEDGGVGGIEEGEAGQLALFGVHSEEASARRKREAGKAARRSALEAFLEGNREKLENPETVKVGFDLKNAENVFRRHGIRTSGPRFDVMVAAYIFQPDGRHESLNALAEAFPEALESEEAVEAIRAAELELQRRRAAWLERVGEVQGEKKSRKGKQEKEPVWPDVLDFEAVQRPFLRNLFVILTARLREARLDSICFELEFPLVGVLAEMERWGIFVRRERLGEISEQFRARIERLREELHALVRAAGVESSEEGEELNFNSPKQLQRTLFETLKLPVQRRTKTGPSTDAQTLEELAAQHPFPARLLEYRQMVKLQNTYVEALPKLIRADGRIHTSFNQAVTATGRLSSSAPNLQNIPVRTDEGKMIRSAFVPEKPGWAFVSADYSQIELRVLAHYCGDRNLQEAFLNGEDIHARVAGQIYGASPEQVTSDMRRVAKTVNFGIIYGQSAFGLAAQLKIPQDEARTFIQTYFMQFPSIGLLLDAILDHTLKTSEISTLFGRRRRIQGVRRVRKGQLNQAERMAVNTVIQGSAADLIKLAMLRVFDRLRREDLAARLLLQIHDELLVECPQEEIEAVSRILQEEMTGAWKLSVPLKVDLAVGNVWE